MERAREFVRLLRKWNASIRLIGDTSDEAVQRHLDDAASLLPVLPDSSRVVDVGSGNGLPAIPIAIARPDLALTLVEPIAKKVAFLRECRRALRLDNVEVVRARDDELIARESFRPFDVAVSQATFAPAVWLERGAALVKPGGLVVAMVGEDRADLDQDDLTIREIETTDGRRRALVLRHIPATCST